MTHQEMDTLNEGEYMDLGEIDLKGIERACADKKIEYIPQY